MDMPPELKARYYPQGLALSFCAMLGAAAIIALHFGVSIDDWPAILVGLLLADALLTLPRLLRLGRKKAKPPGMIGRSMSEDTD